MPVNAGRISISLTADARQLSEEMDRASAKVESSVATIRNSLASLQTQFANAGTNATKVSDGIDKIQESAKRSSGASSALQTLESGFRRTAEGAAALGASGLALETFFLGTAKGAVATTASLGTMADGLTNVYRAARLAFSPTLFTAGSLALGYAVEQIGKATYGAGGTLRDQGTIAGLNRVPISTDQVSALSQAGGANSLQSLLGLYNSSGGKNLRDIAEQLNAIKDPADKARTAVSLFGSDASTALKLLNENFVENSDRVQDWSLTYSGETKTRIEQFRNDIESLKAPFTGLSDVVSDAGTKIKAVLVGLFAAGYGKIRDGSLIGDALAPFNLDRYADAIPGARGAGSGAASGIGGLFSTARAAVSGGFLSQFATIQGPSLFGTADAQFQNELQRNFRNDKNRTNFLSSAASAFPQSVIPDSATSLAGINSGTGIDALRDQLEGLRSRRSQIISQYFTRDADGKLQFKDDTTAVQQASSVASLQTTDRNIQLLQARIEAFTQRKPDAGSAQLQQLAAEAAAARTELARFPSNADPFFETLAKAAARASEEIAKVTSERKQLGQKPPTLTEVADASGNALTIQLSRLQVESKQKQAAIDKDLVDGAARLNQELAKQDVEEQKKLEVINAQTAAIRLQADAVGKGFAAQRQADIAGITARGTASGERPEAVQAQIAQSIAQINLATKGTLNQIAAQTEAIRLQIEAVGKGRDAERAAQFASIRATGLAENQDPSVVQANIAKLEAQNQLADATRGVGQTAGAGFNQFFHDFEDNTKSAGVQVREVLGGAFGSLDNQLTRLITGQKASFADFFRGIAAQIASLALNNAFGSIFQGLGLGQSAGNDTTDAFGGLGVSGGSSGGSGGGIGGSLLGGLLKGLIGGFRAEGGDVSGGTPYVVGERGPELFVPGGRGSIVPNGAASGRGGDTIYVDAREATNSADVEARVNRAIRQAHQAGARDGARLSREARRRVPNSKAFAT